MRLSFPKALLLLAGSSLVGASAVVPVPQSDGGASCLERARDDAALDASTSLRLCRYSNSAAPVDCFRSARSDGLLSDATAVQLCRCAISEEPARCYHRARTNQALSDPVAVTICAAEKVGPRTPYCQLESEPFRATG